MKSKEFMQMALELSLLGREEAPPNPWVGAVVVKDHQLLGQGYHQGPKTPHAEAVALNAIDARGATLYSTLEPCCHHGFTPPCVTLIKDKGIQHVVVGIEDPDPKVCGQGIKELQRLGISVTKGVLANEIRDSLLPYLTHRTQKRPYIIVKAAVSLDGKIATNTYQSKWISCSEARNDVHLTRAHSQAILIGCNTLLQDNPKLTCRLPTARRQPLRIIVDRKGRTTHIKHPKTTLIVTTEPYKKHFGTTETLAYPHSIEWSSLLADLAKRGIVQLLVEGGQALFTQFLQNNLFDELHLYVGPFWLGTKGHSFLEETFHMPLDQPSPLQLKEVTQIGKTQKIIYTRSENLFSGRAPPLLRGTKEEAPCCDSVNKNLSPSTSIR